MLTQLKHLLHSTGYSLAGIAATFRTEKAFQQECVLLVLLPIIGILCGFSLPEILVVCMGWLMVMAFELVNSGLEALCDLVMAEKHPAIKKAKDAASAAIFMAICVNVLLWIFLFVN